MVVKLMKPYRGSLTRTSCTPSPHWAIALATPIAIVSSRLFTNSTISACRQHAHAVFAHHTPIVHECSLSKYSAVHTEVHRSRRCPASSRRVTPTPPPTPPPTPVPDGSTRFDGSGEYDNIGFSGPHPP